MRVVELVAYYFFWHYGRALSDLFRQYVTLLWFVFNFFSIPELLRTFVSPFQRMQERYGGGLDLEDFFGVIVVNLLMRIVGMIVRSFVIVGGLLVLAAALAGGIAYLILWPLLPLVVFWLLMNGVTILASSL